MFESIFNDSIFLSNFSSPRSFFFINNEKKKKKFATATLANLHYLHSLFPFKVFDHRFRFTRLPFSIPSRPSSTDKSDNFLPPLPCTRIAFTSKCTVYDGARNYCIFLLSSMPLVPFFSSLVSSFLKKCFIRDEIASRAFQEKYFYDQP